MVRFRRHLLRHLPGKLLVLWDGAPIHRAQPVRDFLAAGGAARIYLEQLPGYAPELNPDEGIRGYLKQVELRNVSCDDLPELQQELAKVHASMPIIFITGYGDIPMTVRAMKAGAIDFLTKPFRDEDLLTAVAQALHRARQMVPDPHPPTAATPAAAEDRRSERHFPEIIGTSAALRRVLQAIETVAPTDATVLLLGETGTGKEVLARAIHRLSRRSAQAFVKLNCAAIPTGLLESELFGHEKGAFTGAIAQRIGRFELAQRGTIFLDEVGELPLEVQPKLLRVLQEREFERLGSPRTLRTEARLIAATNCNLSALVEAQAFRADLFYRLNVFPVCVPPLRERPEDIPLLVRHCVAQCAQQMQRTIDTIPSATLDALCRYPWPGNIRELQNCLERAVILSRGSELEIPLGELKLSNDAEAAGTGLSSATTAGAASSKIFRVARRTTVPAPSCKTISSAALNPTTLI